MNNRFTKHPYGVVRRDGRPFLTVLRDKAASFADFDVALDAVVEALNANPTLKAVSTVQDELLAACKGLLAMSGGPEGLDMGGPVDPATVRQAAVRAIHDTYDPSRGGTRCVYGYWKQEVPLA